MNAVHVNDYESRLQALLLQWDEEKAQVLYQEVLTTVVQVEPQWQEAQRAGRLQHADMLQLELTAMDEILETLEDRGVVSQLEDHMEEEKAPAPVNQFARLRALNRQNGYILNVMKNDQVVHRGAIWSNHACSKTSCIICYEEQYCHDMFSCPQCVNTKVCADCFARLDKCPTCRLPIF